MPRIKRCVKSKNAVKKLPLVKPYVPDHYKTKEMCDKAIIGNGGILGFIPDFYKNQKTCGKAVGNYSHAFRFVRRHTVLQNTKILTTFYGIPILKLFSASQVFVCISRQQELNSFKI